MDTLSLTGLSHAQLRVSHLEASVAWYERALGLVELRRDPERYVALHSASGHFRLVLSPGGTADSRGALDHIAFAVSDLDALTAWCEHLTAIGIAHQGIERNIAGHSVDLFDPDGNNVELVAEG
jgi:glyoxylase I family protein